MGLVYKKLEKIGRSMYLYFPEQERRTAFKRCSITILRDGEDEASVRYFLDELGMQKLAEEQEIILSFPNPENGRWNYDFSGETDDLTAFHDFQDAMTKEDDKPLATRPNGIPTYEAMLSVWHPMNDTRYLVGTGSGAHMVCTLAACVAENIAAIFAVGGRLCEEARYQAVNAANIAANASIVAKNNARLEFEELRTVDIVDEMGESAKVVVGRLAEVRFVDVNTGIVLSTHNVPYGSTLYVSDGDLVEKGKLIAKWDPFNAVIITEATGKIEFEGVIENVTYKVESDEATGLREIIIIESKDKTKVPTAHILTEDGDLIRTYNLPVGGHVIIENGQKVKAGEVIVKIPRAVGKAGDITGGLPRVTELFEARNPSNPAVVSEIDGEVTMGKIKRGNREIIVTSKTGEVKKYLVALSKQILVQENDYVRAGTPLSDGATTPADILAIKGPTAVQEYIVNEVQDVYRLQGVKINDKHFEIIVRQMMRKVQIDEPGDTRFLEQQVVDKLEFMEENDRIWGKKVVVDAGDSQNMQAGQIVTARKLRDENSMLKRRDLKPVEVRDAVAATSTQILQGITRAALQTSSFMSAASFQETTKVLNEAAINGKIDKLEGMKENVICGHLIPAGTGQREFEKLIVGSKEEYDRILANKKTVLDYNEVE